MRQIGRGGVGRIRDRLTPLIDINRMVDFMVWDRLTSTLWDMFGSAVGLEERDIIEVNAVEKTRD